MKLNLQTILYLVQNFVPLMVIGQILDYGYLVRAFVEMEQREDFELVQTLNQNMEAQCSKSRKKCNFLKIFYFLRLKILMFFFLWGILGIGFCEGGVQKKFQKALFLSNFRVLCQVFLVLVIITRIRHVIQIVLLQVIYFY